MMPLVFVLGLAGAAPQLAPQPAPRIQVQPRDPGRKAAPEPVGTGVIRGRVVAGDTGSPIRRASVSLVPVAPRAVTTAAGTPALPGGTTRTEVVNGQTLTMALTQARPRTATTDAQGAFEFAALPAGTYRITAQPSTYAAAYLPTSYGAKRSNASGSSDSGTPIELADGQTFDKATVSLIRGAVIAGRVTDDNGEALARVQVYSIMVMGGSSRGIRNGNAMTDDLGQFRMFGLNPGDYVVAAEARGGTSVAPNAPPETEEDRIGFVTTYYPGTPDDAAAQRVRARAGAETPGIEIRMVSGRLLHVTGTVMDSQGRTGGRTNGTLMKRGTGMGATATFGFSTDEQGRFRVRNIPPGTYRLTIRQMQPPPPGGRAGGPPDLGEFASMPLTVNGDVDDLLITTSPGAAIAGTVTFENGPPPPAPNQTPFQMRVIAQFGDPESMAGTPGPPPATVTPEMTFTLRGLSGEMLLRSNGPNVYLKSVTVGGEDVTDTPHEFKNGDRVAIVLSSRASTLEGTVTDAAGKPASDTSLLLFSDDKASWRGSSIRTKRGATDATGHYRITGLLPGRYLLVALPFDRMTGLGSLADPSVFEALAKEGTALVIGEDDQRTVDVKVSSGGL